MIHTVPRWSVRMHSGAVHVIDPLEVRVLDTIPAVERDFVQAVGDAVGNVGDGYVLVYAYDRLDSKVAGTRVVLFLSHVESIAAMDVQIEAPEDVSFPVDRT